MNVVFLTETFYSECVLTKIILSTETRGKKLREYHFPFHLLIRVCELLLKGEQNEQTQLGVASEVNYFKRNGIAL